MRNQPTARWALPVAAAVAIFAVIAAATVAVVLIGTPPTPAVRLVMLPGPALSRPSNFATMSALMREPTATPDAAASFDSTRAMAHVRAIAAIGPRLGGSAEESRAFAYVREQFVAMGYATRVTTVTLPGGKFTRNVSATKTGTGRGIVVLGAHADTKPPSPGGNDNASGVGAMLEMARVYRDRPTTVTLEFVAFGCEETAFEGTTDHHFGSRAFAAQLKSERPDEKIAAFSIDMIGVGPVFAARTMDKGPQGLRRALIDYAKGHGFPLMYVKDTGDTGSSDHEPFENNGWPAVWVQWRQDPNYHTTRDTAATVSRDKVGATGRLLAGFLEGVNEARIIGWYAR